MIQQYSQLGCLINKENVNTNICFVNVLLCEFCSLATLPTGRQVCVK
jgi:hypothetical protein